MTDYPHIRADVACPFCNRPRKQEGAIACWPCFRAEGLTEGLRYYTNRDQRAVLDARESKLAILNRNPVKKD